MYNKISTHLHIHAYKNYNFSKFFLRFFRNFFRFISIFEIFLSLIQIFSTSIPLKNSSQPLKLALKSKFCLPRSLPAMVLAPANFCDFYGDFNAFNYSFQRKLCRNFFLNVPLYDTPMPK